jgi:hypothetical protein
MDGKILRNRPLGGNETVRNDGATEDSARAWRMP